MTPIAIKPKRAEGMSSRELIMDYCPECHGSTAFEFDSHNGYSVSCLNCGYTQKSPPKIFEMERAI